MKIKARGASRRITISFTPTTYEALRKESEKLGYSVAEIARRVVDQGTIAEVVRATQHEHREQLHAKINQLHEKYIKLLRDRAENMHGWIAELRLDRTAQEKLIKQQGELIKQQAEDIEGYAQARVRDVVPGSTPGTTV